MINSIITLAVYPPTPTSAHDWVAYFDWDAEEQQLTGVGATKEEAVLDLLSIAGQLEEESGIEELINMAFAYWKQSNE